MNILYRASLVMLALLYTSHVFAEQCPENTEQRTYDLADGIVQLDLESTRACALQGNIRAQKDLGIAYATGRHGLAQNFDEALK